MKIWQCLLWVSIVLATGSAAQPAQNLDELYRRVQENGAADARINQQRLEEFRRARDRQQQLLREAQAEVAEKEVEGETLNRSISENERELAALQQQLDERSGNFGELFGVTRQVAADTRAQVENSLISAQFPGREKNLAAISDSKALPSVDELRALWLVLLQEQTEQGKVARFSAAVNNAQGFPEQRDVIRVGPFTALSDGRYLVYQPETQQLASLGRQPAPAHVHAAEELTDAQAGELVYATVDPSRGTIMSLLVQTPTLLERYHDGGVVGYAVSVLALIGFLIGLQRLFSLWLTSTRVKRQVGDRTPRLNNPLGRILQTYEDNAGADRETLELKLDDAILNEVPRLDRGLNTLKVLAAVAPLMGLLGTVMGMIVTFQAITLWGTGEPKMMANGISQALITTVLGLVAAIPLLLLHSVAQGRARWVQQVLQEQSAGLIARRAEGRHD